MNIEDAVSQLKQVFDVLNRDVNAIIAYENFKEDESAHRSLIRAHFAFIEGMVYQLRSVALASGAKTGTFSAEEIAVLREETYSLNRKGELEKRDSFEKVLPMMLFSMSAYAKIHGAVFEPDTGSHGWEAMKKYVKIRNALTHPKSVDDLQVDEGKVEISGDAGDWFKDNLLNLFKVCDEADRKCF